MDSTNLQNEVIVTGEEPMNNNDEVLNPNIEEYVNSIKDDNLTKELAFLDKICQDITECCDIHCYLDEGILKDGKIENRVPIGERSVLSGFTNVEFFFNMTSKFVTVNIHFKNKTSTEKSAIYNLYDIYMRKADEYFRTNSNKIACFDLYFVRQFENEGFVVRISMSNPIILVKSDEDGLLTAVFDMKAINYGLNPMDYGEIEEEIQNEIADEVRVEEAEERHREEMEAQAEFSKSFTQIVDNDDEDF